MDSAKWQSKLYPGCQPDTARYCQILPNNNTKRPNRVPNQRKLDRLQEAQLRTNGDDENVQSEAKTALKLPVANKACCIREGQGT
eukprot:366222-Chlamydomonas_euryale.AAC.17